MVSPLKNALEFFESSYGTTPKRSDRRAPNKFAGEGYKGYLVGGNLTLAKNMVAQVEYYDLEGKETEKHARTLWSQLVVTF
jgi:outer membrane protein M1